MYGWRLSLKEGSVGLESDGRRSESRFKDYVEATVVLGHADRARPFQSYCTACYCLALFKRPDLLEAKRLKREHIIAMVQGTTARGMLIKGFDWLR
jgi:hypothetical protein